MTMGPEPMTRMRCMSARRGMDQIIYDVVACFPRGPPGRTTELLVTAHQHRHVHRTCTCRICCNVSRDTETLQDSRGELTHRVALSAADVINLACGATFHQRKIGIHDV